MNFILVSVYLSMCVVLSLPIQSMKPHHDAKDLLHLFNTNPTELVSMMQNVNPAQLNQVISLLEGMLTESKNLEIKLQTKVNTKSDELAAAVIEANTAKKKVEELTKEMDAAVVTRNGLVTTVGSKEVELSFAEQELRDQQPSLHDEQQTLRNVIEMLQKLMNRQCTSHSECNNSSFCYQGHCDVCSECHFNHDAIDGKCPVKCPALCEDDPPIYGKCPLCKTQQECDGKQTDEDILPVCEDDSGRCPLDSKCTESADQYMKTETDAAPVKFCQCFHDQAHCVMDANCLSNDTKKMINSQPEKTLDHMCRFDLKCTNAQCSWIPKAMKHVKGHFFLNALAHLSAKWK